MEDEGLEGDSPGTVQAPGGGGGGACSEDGLGRVAGRARAGRRQDPGGHGSKPRGWSQWPGWVQPAGLLPRSQGSQVPVEVLRSRCRQGQLPAAGPPGRVLSPLQVLWTSQSSSRSPLSLPYPAVLRMLRQGFKSPAAITDPPPPSHQILCPMFGSCFQVHNRLQLYVFLMN